MLVDVNAYRGQERAFNLLPENTTTFMLTGALLILLTGYTFCPLGFKVIPLKTCSFFL